MLIDLKRYNNYVFDVELSIGLSMDQMVSGIFFEETYLGQSTG